MAQRYKVLIVVKTYPSISLKYDELVCTAGFLENGDWVRIYPIPFRKLDFEKQYSKYQWIELELEKNSQDFRPESFKPVNIETMQLLDKVEADGKDWALRRKLCLNKVYTNLTDLIAEAKNELIRTSLAVFKPKRITNFIIENESREWDKEKLDIVMANRKQLNLFASKTISEDVADKLPYKFSYVFEDETGREATFMIEDWEIGALYWNSLRVNAGSEIKAKEAVIKKYYLEFVGKKDIYFFLGTTRQWHLVSPNPFVIIGIFYPGPITQLSLF